MITFTGTTDKVYDLDLYIYCGEENGVPELQKLTLGRCDSVKH
jgi:hypothetical protein